jgi:hypothetical protein
MAVNSKDNEFSVLLTPSPMYLHETVVDPVLQIVAPILQQLTTMNAVVHPVDIVLDEMDTAIAIEARDESTLTTEPATDRLPAVRLRTTLPPEDGMTTLTVATTLPQQIRMPTDVRPTSAGPETSLLERDRTHVMDTHAITIAVDATDKPRTSNLPDLLFFFLSLLLFSV